MCPNNRRVQVRGAYTHRCLAGDDWCIKPSTHLLPRGERLDELLDGARAVGVERHAHQLPPLARSLQHLRLQ